MRKLNELIPVILSLIGIVLGSGSVIYAYKSRKIMEEQANILLNTLDETLEKAFAPINEKISKSYSQLGHKGATAKQIKALDKRIGQDVINMQDPLIQGALDMFPNVKEYVLKNPNMLQELLPRIAQLQQIEGFKPMDLISPSPSNTPNPSKSHPFGLEE